MPNRRHRRPVQRNTLRRDQLEAQAADAKSNSRTGSPRGQQIQYPFQEVFCRNANDDQHVETICPQPRRTLPSSLFQNQDVFAADGQLESRHRPRSPGSACSADADEAANELRELLGSGRGPSVGDYQIFTEGIGVSCSCSDSFGVICPSSSVSTSAGPTPSPDEQLNSPAGWAPLERYSTTPTLEDCTFSSRGGFGDRSGAGSQNRKIFVGGIPQDMNEDDLYTIFCEFAGVKKAWLQRYRPNMGESTPPHNHRGFGFVIFYDSSAVEQLLKTNFSKFISVPHGNGVQLEVKRAVSSADMGTHTNSSLVKSGATNYSGTRHKVSVGAQNPNASQHWQQQMPMPPAIPNVAWAVPPSGSGGTVHGIAQTSVRTAGQVSQAGSGFFFQAPEGHGSTLEIQRAPPWQAQAQVAPRHPWVHPVSGQGCHPSAEATSSVEPRQARLPQQPQPITASRLSTAHGHEAHIAAAQGAGATAAMLAQQALLSSDAHPPETSELYKRELEAVLRSAMPDHYDD